MRTIIYFFTGLFLCFSSIENLQAQEVENPPEALTDQTWYLTKMIIDEVEMPFTPNEEVEYVELIIGSFSQDFVEVVFYFCDGPTSNIVLQGEDEFYMGDLMFLMNRDASDITTNSYCNLEDNIILENIYFYEFWNNPDLILGSEYPQSFHFFYTINQLEEHQELIVINDYGYEAHFQSVPTMSVKNQQQSSLTLYPNPVDDFLHLENLTEPAQIEIYNLSGKLLLSQEINKAEKRVNLSRLGEGIYLYQLRQQGQNIKTGKLVKK